MILRHIYIILLSLLALAIPIYQTGILSLFILLLSVLSIIRINPKRKVAWGSVLLSGLLVFLVLIISLLWSLDINTGLKNIETKLSLALIPLIIGTSEPLNRKDFLYVKTSFLVGLFLSMVLHLGRALNRTEGLEDISAFYYGELAWVFHPSYLSLYVVCGVAMVLFDKERNLGSKLSNWLANGFIFLSICFVALLSSKAGLITLIGVLVANIIFTIVNRKQTIEKILGICFFLTLLNIIVFSPTTSQRVKSGTVSTIKKEVDPNDPINSTVRNTTAVRLVAWESSLKIMNESPFGKGIGDGKRALLDRYKSDEEYFMHARKFNAHNQFFEIGLYAGWFGFFILVLSLLILFIRAVHIKDWVLAVILVVITLNMLSESMLERQSGAVFIPFIICLLVFRELEIKPIKKQ